jgi:hypothetical protein
VVEGGTQAEGTPVVDHQRKRRNVADRTSGRTALVLVVRDNGSQWALSSHETGCFSLTTHCVLGAVTAISQGRCDTCQLTKREGATDSALGGQVYDETDPNLRGLIPCRLRARNHPVTTGAAIVADRLLLSAGLAGSGVCHGAGYATHSQSQTGKWIIWEEMNKNLFCC